MTGISIRLGHKRVVVIMRWSINEVAVRRGSTVVHLNIVFMSILEPIQKCLNVLSGVSFRPFCATSILI